MSSTHGSHDVTDRSQYTRGTPHQSGRSGALATVLLIGADFALLEGLAQTLGASGHTSIMVRDVNDALDVQFDRQPIVAVVERAQVYGPLTRIPLQRGGAVVVYDGAVVTHDALGGGLRKLVLAELVLPLERQRLLALVQSVAARCEATGRGRVSTPTQLRSS